MKGQILRKIIEIDSRKKAPSPIGIDSLLLMLRVDEGNLRVGLAVLEYEGYISLVPPARGSHLSLPRYLIYTPKNEDLSQNRDGDLQQLGE